MNEERVFSFDEISYSNLSALSKKILGALEQRTCEIAFAAEKIANDAKELFDSGMNAYEILALLSEDISLDSAKENPSSVSNTANLPSSLRVFDMIELSSVIYCFFLKNGIEISERSFLEEYESEQTLTYVRNSISDEAYDVFSQQFSDPKVTYSDSFKSAAFAVADGKVGYCILPIEERGGVRIPGILSLISALDLKIISLTPVFGIEGNADMKYALVGRGFKIPSISKDNDRYLEIRIGDDANIGLAELLSAAQGFGHYIYRVGSFTVTDNGEGKIFSSVILRDGGKGFSELLTFMTLFLGEYTAVGIYENIE